MRTLLFSWLGCIFLLAPIAGRAQSPVQIEQAWSRPALAGGTGVVYFTATDESAPDRLNGASTPVAKSASLHQSAEAGGVETMRAVQGGLPIAPGQPIRLSPGGYHLMLMSLKRDLKPGDRFPLTVTFAHAGPLRVTVEVRATPPAPAEAMPGMKMDRD